MILQFLTAVNQLLLLESEGGTLDLWFHTARSLSSKVCLFVRLRARTLHVFFVRDCIFWFVIGLG